MHREDKEFIKELLVYGVWVFLAMVVITVVLNMVVGNLFLSQ